jgi:hypothetical protein
MVLAGHGRLLLGEHRAGDAQRVLEPLEALGDRRELVAERPVLVLEPGGADTEHRTPAGEHVERGRHLRHQRGVAIGHAAHHQAELDVRGAGRERRERGVAL